MLAAVIAAPCALRAQGEFGHSASSTLEIVQAAASMENKIGAQLDTNLEFTDERGYPFQLKQLFPGERPVVLVLGYYGCPDMCGQVIHGMLDALNRVDLVPGKDYQIVNVSIDPRETAEKAAQRKQTFLPQLHQVGGPEGWRFLVAKQPDPKTAAAGAEADATSIKALADSVGFRYFWSEHTNRFDHPGALLFLTPQGKLNRVITGSTFEPDDVRLAILETGKGEKASFWDKVKLSCLTWDSRSNSYTLTAMTVMRIGGVVTMLAIGTMIYVMIRRERRRATTPATT